MIHACSYILPSKSNNRTRKISRPCMSIYAINSKFAIASWTSVYNNVPWYKVTVCLTWSEWLNYSYGNKWTVENRFFTASITILEYHSICRSFSPLSQFDAIHKKNHFFCDNKIVGKVHNHITMKIPRLFLIAYPVGEDSRCVCQS